MRSILKVAAVCLVVFLSVFVVVKTARADVTLQDVLDAIAAAESAKYDAGEAEADSLTEQCITAAARGRAYSNYNESCNVTLGCQKWGTAEETAGYGNTAYTTAQSEYAVGEMELDLACDEQRSLPDRLEDAQEAEGYFDIAAGYWNSSIEPFQSARPLYEIVENCAH